MTTDMLSSTLPSHGDRSSAGSTHPSAAFPLFLCMQCTVRSQSALERSSASVNTPAGKVILGINFWSATSRHATWAVRCLSRQSPAAAGSCVSTSASASSVLRARLSASATIRPHSAIGRQTLPTRDIDVYHGGTCTASTDSASVQAADDDTLSDPAARLAPSMSNSKHKQVF